MGSLKIISSWMILGINMKPKLFSSLHFLIVAIYFLIFLDATIVPVSLPTVEKELGFSTMISLWIVNAYTLTLCSLMLTGGKIVDIYGGSKLFFIGMVFFLIGSIVCGGAISGVMLIIGRVVQGVGGAVLLPAVSSILTGITDKRHLGKVMGGIASISSMAFLVGPAIGGLLTQFVSWRAIYVINVPLILIVFFISFFLLPPNHKNPGKLHLRASLCFFLMMICFVLVLMQLASWPKWVLGILLVASLLFFELFRRMNRQSKDSLAPPSLFKASIIEGLCFILLGAFVLTVSIVQTFFLQKQLNYTPSETGLLAIFKSVPLACMAPIAGFLSDRFGRNIPLILGHCCFIFSLSWFLFHPKVASLALIAPSFIVYGLAPPLFFTTCASSIYKIVSSSERGRTSSLVGTLRQVGSSIGIAILGVIYSHLSLTQGMTFGLNVALGCCIALLSVSLIYLITKTLVVTYAKNR